jgi:hypothetical protein
MSDKNNNADIQSSLLIISDIKDRVSDLERDNVSKESRIIRLEVKMNLVAYMSGAAVSGMLILLVSLLSHLL